MRFIHHNNIITLDNTGTVDPTTGNPLSEVFSYPADEFLRDEPQYNGLPYGMTSRIWTDGRGILSDGTSNYHDTLDCQPFIVRLSIYKQAYEDRIAINGPPEISLDSIQNSAYSSNILMNGNFDIWQRGTMFITLSDHQYTADRFLFTRAGSMVYSCEQSQDTPDTQVSASQSEYSLLLTCTTSQETVNTDDYVCIEQRVEGSYIRMLYNTTASISFYVKASIPGVYCVSISNNIDKTMLLEYTIEEADTWERKDIPFDIDIANGTWPCDNLTGIRIIWCLGAGSTYTTDPRRTWKDGVYYGTSAQTSVSQTVNATFALSQVQLVHGKIIQPFQQKTQYQELIDCMRYYEKSYPVTITPGNELHTGLVLLPLMYTKNKYFALYFPFQVPKRSVPSMRSWDAEGNTNRHTAWTKTWAHVDNLSSDRFSFDATHRGFVYRDMLTSTNYGTIGRHWSADAEL